MVVIAAFCLLMDIAEVVVQLSKMPFAATHKIAGVPYRFGVDSKREILIKVATWAAMSACGATFYVRAVDGPTKRALMLLWPIAYLLVRSSKMRAYFQGVSTESIDVLNGIFGVRSGKDAPLEGDDEMVDALPGTEKPDRLRHRGRVVQTFAAMLKEQFPGQLPNTPATHVMASIWLRDYIRTNFPDMRLTDRRWIVPMAVSASMIPDEHEVIAAEMLRVDAVKSLLSRAQMYAR